MAPSDGNTEVDSTRRTLTGRRDSAWDVLYLPRRLLWGCGRSAAPVSGFLTIYSLLYFLPSSVHFCQVVPAQQMSVLCPLAACNLTTSSSGIDAALDDHGYLKSKRHQTRIFRYAPSLHGRKGQGTPGGVSIPHVSLALFDRGMG